MGWSEIVEHGGVIMIEKTSIYYDTSEVTTKEALWAACAAVKHRPEKKEHFTFDANLPNGKQIVVDSNAACSQIRLVKVP